MKDTKKTKKITYWVMSILIALATCVLGLLETSCDPKLIKNFSDGYQYMYEHIFYTIEPQGDTIYYTGANTYSNELIKIN